MSKRSQFRETEYRVFTFGLDYKVTPDDQVAFIEINGTYSGYEGYVRLHPEARKARDAARLLLNRWLEETGGLEGLEFGDDDDILKKAEKLPKKKRENWQFSVPTKSHLLERVFDHKGVSKCSFPPENRVPGLEWDGGSFEELEGFIDALYDGVSPLVDMERYPFLVCKPVKDSCQGRGIRIFYLRERGRIPHKMAKFIKGKRDYLIEAFVPSKTFENPATGQMHDACGRYLKDYCCSWEQGRFINIYDANYLRLSPEPWSEESFSEDMMKANLCGEKPAIPVDAPDEIKRMVNKVSKDIELNVFALGDYLWTMKKFGARRTL